MEMEMCWPRGPLDAGLGRWRTQMEGDRSGGVERSVNGDEEWREYWLGVRLLFLDRKVWMKNARALNVRLAKETVPKTHQKLDRAIDV